MKNLKPIFDRFEAKGTVFGSLSKANFEQIKILLLPTNVINLFEKIVSKIDLKIEENTISSLTLSQIRDLLLPKLMTGKIRVPYNDKKSIITSSTNKSNKRKL